MKTVALFAVLLASTATLRAEPELNGAWTATFATAAHEQRSAAVVIDGLGGTWNCAGRSVPIALSDSGSSTIMLRIERSTSAGRKRSARLTIVDPLTLEGEFDDGRVLRLVRRPN